MNRWFLKWLTPKEEPEPNKVDIPEPDPLRSLFKRLVLRAGCEFNGFGSGQGKVTTDIDSANLITSRLRDMGPWDTERAHKVLLDIDYPAYVVPSTTEGHFHLYLDVPGGIDEAEYMALLDILGKYRIIEPGYAATSIKRGYTGLRPPWVKKDPEVERQRRERSYNY